MVSVERMFKHETRLRKFQTLTLIGISVEFKDFSNIVVIIYEPGRRKQLSKSPRCVSWTRTRIQSITFYVRVLSVRDRSIPRKENLVNITIPTRTVLVPGKARASRWAILCTTDLTNKPAVMCKLSISA